MARSIKSKRGKMLRRMLRERYKKKSDDHLKKIVDKAKINDLADVATCKAKLIYVLACFFKTCNLIVQGTVRWIVGYLSLEIVRDVFEIP